MVGHVLESVLDGVDAADMLGRVRLGDRTFAMSVSFGQDETQTARRPDV